MDNDGNYEDLYCNGETFNESGRDCNSDELVVVVMQVVRVNTSLYV